MRSRIATDIPKRVIEAKSSIHRSTGKESIRRPKTGALGIIIPATAPRFDDPQILSILGGLGQQAAQHQVDLRIATHPPDSQAERNAYLRATAGGWVDGLIVIDARRDDWRLKHLHTERFPFVSLGRSNLPFQYSHIYEESLTGIKQAINHLRQLNHKKIAMIAPPENVMHSITRRDGFVKVLRQHRLVIRPEWILTGENGRDSGYDLMNRLLAQKNRPTAVLAGSTPLADGAIAALDASGQTIGDKISLIGYGKMERADFTGEQPFLTTLQLPLFQVAEKLAHLLLNNLQLPSRVDSYHSEQMVPKLMIGRSTGPARSKL